jgi:hypothetical protein
MIGNVATVGQGKPDPDLGSKYVRLRAWKERRGKGGSDPSAEDCGLGGGTLIQVHEIVCLGDGPWGGRESLYVEVLSSSTYKPIDCGVHSMADHELSREDDWDLLFPPNPGIHDLGETSDGDSSDSGGGEGPAMLQSNYVDLHALHDYRDGRKRRSATSGGAGTPSTSRLSLEGRAAGSQGKRVQMSLQSGINLSTRHEEGGSHGARRQSVPPSLLLLSNLPSSSQPPFFFPTSLLLPNLPSSSHSYYQFGTPIQSMLSSQPPTMNPHLPSMPQFPLPFHFPQAQFRHSWPLVTEPALTRRP